MAWSLFRSDLKVKLPNSSTAETTLSTAGDKKQKHVKYKETSDYGVFYSDKEQSTGLQMYT